MSVPVDLYSATDVGLVSWPNTPEGDEARRYLAPLLRDGPTRYVRNADTQVYALRVDNALIVPATAGAFNPANSYVVSPYAHYITYGQEEFATLKNPPAEALLRLLFRPLAAWFRRAQFDHAVLANNWLLSTNLPPSGLSEARVSALLRALAAAFPDRAVIFRSVDRRGAPALTEALSSAGAALIFSRQVYYQDVAQRAVQRRDEFRADLRLLRRRLSADLARPTPYTVLTAADLQPGDAERLAALYADLYLRKYSRYNPQFTPDFLRLALAERLLTIKALAHAGRIDAVLGYVTRGAYITAPLFGYDTALPKQVGLYRMLTALTSLDALTLGKQVHFSAGVGPFKRLRGGQATIEYNAVYTAHLPAWRRRPWRFLQTLLERVAVPIIQRSGF
ncbi:MAG: GNAT family N-acetyltransferase [Anaerolineales bacterium]|nr:GNAT family N-acetyltransferase [Anaerolineales bacterium]